MEKRGKKKKRGTERKGVCLIQKRQRNYQERVDGSQNDLFVSIFHCHFSFQPLFLLFVLILAIEKTSRLLSTLPPSPLPPATPPQPPSPRLTPPPPPLAATTQKIRMISIKTFGNSNNVWKHIFYVQPFAISSLVLIYTICAMRNGSLVFIHT